MTVFSNETASGRKFKWPDLLVFIFICVLTLFISLLMFELGVRKENVVLLLLVGVLLSTILTGNYWYGIFASIISWLSYNFFFTEPLLHFDIYNRQDVVMMTFFIIITLFCGFITSRMRYRANLAHYNEKTTQMIYEVTEHFLNKSGVADVVESAIGYIHDLTGYECCVQLSPQKFPHTQLEYSSAYYQGQKLTHELPIRGLTDQIGTIYFNEIDTTNNNFDTDKFIHVVIYQMALVLDRECMVMEQEQLSMAMERERVKTTLLRSISHDIRSPLTAITGSSSTILDNYDELDDESIKSLVNNIREESIWLNLTVQNILDLTRVTSGELKLDMEYEAIDDLINQALSRFSLLTDKKPVHVVYPRDILMIKVDGRLFVQLLVNLLDNAYKHAGPEASVELLAYRQEKNAVIEVRDDGQGIDEDVMPRIFDSFITMTRHRSDKGRGVGLGLSICKAIVEAHNGTIEAENRGSGGAAFRVVIPLEDE